MTSMAAPAPASAADVQVNVINPTSRLSVAIGNANRRLARKSVVRMQRDDQRSKKANSKKALELDEQSEAAGMGESSTRARNKRGAIALPKSLIQTFAHDLPHAIELFEKLDADASGELSESEFARGLARHGIGERKARQIFREIDADGTGTLALGPTLFWGGNSNLSAARARTAPRRRAGLSRQDYTHTTQSTLELSTRNSTGAFMHIQILLLTLARQRRPTLSLRRSLWGLLQGMSSGL